MNRAAFAALVLLAAGLAGCASSMSGLGGTDRYACKAPEGAVCSSVSGVYANSVAGTLPSTKPAATAAQKAAPSSPLPKPQPEARPAPQSTAAASASIRSAPRVLRLWVAPWEDADGDLHEEALVHVVVDTGRWLIEHVRPAARSGIDGVKPPLAPAPESPAGQAPADAQPAPARFPIPPSAQPLDAEPSVMGR